MSESLKDKIINLKSKGMTYKEIGNELKCSKGTISYHCNNSGLGSDLKISEKLITKIKKYYNDGNSCEKTAKKFGVGKTTVRSYVDIRKKITLTEEEKKKRRVEAVVKRRRKVKEMAIEYKGGCCSCCGYDKYNGALEFHHIDPKEKDFSLGAKGHCTAWEKVKKELDKCILVCANCHREIHIGLIEI